MDPKLKAVYDRMYAREMAARAIIFRQYPSFVATWVHDRFGKALSTSVVHRWWRDQSVFAFRHEGRYFSVSDGINLALFDPARAQCGGVTQYQGSRVSVAVPPKTGA